jgi:DNA-directed RNA polymerase II subunit RPB1
MATNTGIDNSPAARHSQAPHSSAPLKIIKEVQFGLFSPEEIVGMSVVEVKYPETMDEMGSGRPKEGGLGDPKMGSIERGQNCATCYQNANICPGHFGHIELRTAVFHPGKDSPSVKTLMLTC